MRFTAFLIVPVLATAFACSPSDGSSGGGACSRYYSAVVAFSNRCGGTAGELTTSHAASRFDLACQNASTAPGVTSSFAAALDTCINNLNAADCGDLDALSCDPGGGTLDDGAACQESYQCKGYCKRGEGQCGTCAPVVAVGNACTSNEECGPSATCASSADGTKRTCEAKNTKGAGESCFSSEACQKGLVCATGKCAAKKKIGDACTLGDACEASSECRDGKCAALSGEGGPCKLRCGPGLVCNTDDTCRKQTTVPLGAQCDELRACSEGVCVGSAVEVTGDDKGGSKTTFIAGTCKTPIADGQPCGKGIDGACDAFAECVQGTCRVSNPATCK